MKKLQLLPALAFCFIANLFFSACYKTDVNSGNTPGNPNHIPPDQTVIASLKGRVTDENGLPMDGASVVSGGVSTTTDVNGLFSFTNISMSSRWGYVKVSKTGYFSGSRSIITNGAASNYVNLQMIPRAETGSFAANAGGVIVVEPGDSAAFGANAVVTAATTTAYTGTVHVFTKYLNPTDANLYKYMPGDLRGVGSDGNETALQSFGMVLVELQGDGGEKLQLAGGHTATLTWAIPTTLQSAAPATIPLWYFNDSSGRWVEQGSALRTGNSYIGTVSHFSFWNCDAASGTVNFKLHVKDQYGNAAAYSFVQFQSATWGTRGGYTDSAGFVQGLIPKGQSLVMQIVTECGTMLGGVNVGPALTDQDLGTVTITVSSSDLTLSGNVVDCSNNPVDSGYVNVLVDGLNYRAAVTKGAFKLPVHRCYSTTIPIALTAYDFQAQQGGAASMVNGSTGDLNAGQLSACGSPLVQFITLSINGASYNWSAPPDAFNFSAQNMIEYTSGGSASYNYNDIAAVSASGNQSIDIDLYNLNGPGNAGIISAPGSYQSYLNFSAPHTNFGFGNKAQLTVTTVGGIGSYIIGTLSGNLRDTISGQTYPLTGNFKVQKTQ